MEQQCKGEVVVPSGRDDFEIEMEGDASFLGHFQDQLNKILMNLFLP